MGCDIHMYVEYRSKKQQGKEFWTNFGKRFNPGRNYSMFGLISKGVRVENESGLEPKGKLDVMGWVTSKDAYLYINDEFAEKDYYGFTTLDRAIKWQDYDCKIIYNDQGKADKIEHPDWHSHTWLSTEEFENVIDNFMKIDGANLYPPIEYMAILSAMKAIENNDYEVRAVIWFDN